MWSAVKERPCNTMAGRVGVPTIPSIPSLSPEGSRTCIHVAVHARKKNTEIPQDCWTQNWVVTDTDDLFYGVGGLLWPWPPLVLLNSSPKSCQVGNILEWPLKCPAEASAWGCYPEWWGLGYYSLRCSMYVQPKGIIWWYFLKNSKCMTVSPRQGSTGGLSYHSYWPTWGMCA